MSVRISIKDGTCPSGSLSAATADIIAHNDYKMPRGMCPRAWDVVSAYVGDLLDDAPPASPEEAETALAQCPCLHGIRLELRRVAVGETQ